MQTWIIVKCICGEHLGETIVDTADEPEDVQLRLNTIILAHRQECKYYRQEGRTENAKD